MKIYAGLLLFTGLVFNLSCAAQDELASNGFPNELEVQAVSVDTLVDDIDAGAGGLAIDGDGNLYTADFGWRLDGRGKGGNKIFKVDPSGKSELFCSEIRGASGNRIGAKGNLFQANIGGNYISKVTADGKASIYARGSFKNPVGIAIDDEGNLFVCSCGANQIHKVTPDGTESVFCKSELFKCPNGITLADDGNLYVANFYNGDVIKIDPKGTASKLATLPGDNNGHLAYHKGFLYVVARTANQIYRVSLKGKSELFAGSGKRGKEDGKPLESTLSLPNSIVVSPDGKYMYFNETSVTSGDPKILGPTRIRRIELGESEDESSVQPASSLVAATNVKPKVTIDDVAWIAGHWQGEAMGGQFEETWNPPMGGAMMGMFKLVNDDKINFYELLTIVPSDDSLLLRLKHFSNDLKGWEEKDKSVEFPLVEITKDEVKFDGLTFTKINENEMHIIVVVNQGDAGPQEIKFECKRVKK